MSSFFKWALALGMLLDGARVKGLLALGMLLDGARVKGLLALGMLLDGARVKGLLVNNLRRFTVVKQRRLT